MMAQQLNVEVISNNIANATTNGYKRTRAQFADLLYQDLRRVGTQSADTGTIVPAGVQIGLGVKPVSIYRIAEQGSLIMTDNFLDVAIKGRGLFQVTLPDGTTAYTRDGSLKVDNEGTIVTSDGFALEPEIVIPADATNVTINGSGEVQVTVQSDPTPQIVGQFELATFINDAGLLAQGDNLLLETEASGPPTTGVPGVDGIGTIQQFFIETSNVNVVQEMTDLITAQRTYEINSKVIQASDDMMATISQLR
jgi:flagellar basal-body rod protein FlgG